MNAPAAPVTVTLRIPGSWDGPQELVARLPENCRLTPEVFELPDGTRFDFAAMPADDQFASVFRSACREPASDLELATIDSYSVNLLLSGPGGSLAAARALMQAGSVLVRAGGAGVFIDNSALAHGGGIWLAMTEDGGPDAVSFAFVAIVRGQTDVWTMGMHVLGLRDIIMKRSDVEVAGFDIVEVIRYLARNEKPVEDRHIVADLDGPRFQAFIQPATGFPRESPMFNPFGRLKLVSMQDIAEAN